MAFCIYKLMRKRLLGAIIGDISGSSYEFRKHRTKKKEAVHLTNGESDFTDDTICTIAIADAIMRRLPFKDSLIEWCKEYNAKGCGGMFRKWVYAEDPQPYGSWGNGSAMRVSPVGWLATSLPECLDLARETAMCSHNSIEAVLGAQCIAMCIYLARQGKDKDYIRAAFLRMYPDWDKTLDEIRPSYGFDSSCQGSVPVAVLAFLESEDYESCLINAISMGGDADTLAAMAGGIALAYYKQIPQYLIDFAEEKLPNEILDVISDFDVYADEHLHSAMLQSE